MSTLKPLMDQVVSFLCKKKNVTYMYTTIVHHDLFLFLYPDKNVAPYIKNGFMKCFELSYNGPVPMLNKTIVI